MQVKAEMEAAAGREVSRQELDRLIEVLQKRRIPKAEWSAFARQTGEEMGLRGRVKAAIEGVMERELTPAELQSTISDFEAVGHPRESWPAVARQLARRIVMHQALRTIFKQFRSAAADDPLDLLDLLDTFAGLASPGYQQAVEIAGLTKEEDPWGKPLSAGVPPDSSLRLSN